MIWSKRIQILYLLQLNNLSFSIVFSKNTVDDLNINLLLLNIHRALLIVLLTPTNV